jgi:hypothetical protein
MWLSNARGRSRPKRRLSKLESLLLQFRVQVSHGLLRLENFESVSPFFFSSLVCLVVLGRLLSRDLTCLSLSSLAPGRPSPSHFPRFSLFLPSISFLLLFHPRSCLHLDMITLVSSPELPTHKPSLADLSRNASVISSSSSSSSTTSLVLPVRPRPVRAFSSPRSRSPGGPPTPKASRPPAYITRELGIADQPYDMLSGRSRANSKSKSRSSSANGRLSADDFEFGDILGEGSYSTVRLMPLG